MAQFIKIFSTRSDLQKLENDINSWLDNNHSAIVKDVIAAEMRGDAKSGEKFVLTLLCDGEIAGAVNDKKKRQHERKNLFEMLDYTVNGRYYKDFTEDMSESGISIRTNQKFTAGQEISIQFVSSAQERPFNIKGEIVRILPDGVGVQFKPESQVHVDLIKSYIATKQK